MNFPSLPTTLSQWQYYNQDFIDFFKAANLGSSVRGEIDLNYHRYKYSIYHSIKIYILLKIQLVIMNFAIQNLLNQYKILLTNK